MVPKEAYHHHALRRTALHYLHTITNHSKYSLHALPVVSSAEGDLDVVMGVVTDVEVRRRRFVWCGCSHG